MVQLSECAEILLKNVCARPLQVGRQQVIQFVVLVLLQMLRYKCDLGLLNMARALNVNLKKKREKREYVIFSSLHQ